MKIKEGALPKMFYIKWNYKEGGKFPIIREENNISVIVFNKAFECPDDNPDSKWYELISEKEALKIIKDFS